MRGDEDKSLVLNLGELIGDPFAADGIIITGGPANDSGSKSPLFFDT
jgi:hypothetical protein